MIVLMYFLLLLLPVLVYRRLYNQLAEDKFRLRMFKIRDDLRMAAFKGEVDIYSKGFDYLDRSSSLLIKEAPVLSAYYVAFIMLKHGDETKDEFSEYVLQEIKSDPVLSAFLEKQVEAFLVYMLNQHNLTWKLILKPLFQLLSLTGARKALKKFFSRALSMPEFQPGPQNMGGLMGT